MTSFHRETNDWLRYAADVFTREYFFSNIVLEREAFLSANIVSNVILLSRVHTEWLNYCCRNILMTKYPSLPTQKTHLYMQ